MSLSKECHEYHLTPKGWVEGSFKADSLGASVEKDVPPDAVLTVCCYDELTHPKAKAFFYDKEEKLSQDEAMIEKLKEQYGDKPPLFGYAKMKK